MLKARFQKAVLDGMNWLLILLSAALTLALSFLWASFPVLTFNTGSAMFGIAVTTAVAALAFSAVYPRLAASGWGIAFIFALSLAIASISLAIIING